MSLPVSIQENLSFMEDSLEKGMDIVMKSAEIATRYAEESEKPALLKQIDKAMLDMCLLNSRFDNFKNLAREALARDTESERIYPYFEEAVEEARRAPTNPEVHPNYRRLREMIRNTLQPPQPTTGSAAGGSAHDDSEVAITASEVNTIDPFTMKRMVNPMRNRKCGHVYDKYGVENILKTKSSLRCPVVGCPVTSFTMKDLVPDEEMKRVLRESQ